MLLFIFSAKRGKKYKFLFFVFFFPEKVHRSFNWKFFDEFIFFLIKDYLLVFYFFHVFLCFVFFPLKSSSVIHSFNFCGGKNIKHVGKKQIFYSYIHICPTNARKQTFLGKIKYDNFVGATLDRQYLVVKKKTRIEAGTTI